MATYQFVMTQSCAQNKGWTISFSMHNQHSLLYRDEDREMNEDCNFVGVGLIPWSPLKNGRLTRPAKDQINIRAIFKGETIEDQSRCSYY
jgi:aryl-alcohol dehydrogenase-like predicted oxidoreductase